jgi:uncharacterized protein (TIGR02466 family)
MDQAKPLPPGSNAIEAELLFATPLFLRQWSDCDDLNRSLRELLLQRERSEGASDRHYSNVGGWHSPIDLQESWERELRLVLQRCRSLAEEATCRLLADNDASERYRFSLSAWANVSRDGDYNVPHVHETAWSVVYYVCVPDVCVESGSGGLELIDPRPAAALPNMAGAFFATRRLIRPQPGLMVLFPGSVMHFVHPFRGEGERISIACDIGLTPR